MLYVCFDGHPDVEWHTGKDFPKLIGNHISDVTMLQADGHELDHIKSMFNNPDNIFPKGRVVKLYGDLARTIVANL